MEHLIVIGGSGVGKTTFATKFTPRYLAINADGRWEEQTDVASVSYVVNMDSPVKIAMEMDRRRPDLAGKIGTVIFDSGTAILEGAIAKGQLQVASKNELGLKINANDVNRVKAQTMRALAAAALGYNCSILWIFHKEESSQDGNRKTRITLPPFEMERMKKYVSAVIELGVKDGKRFVQILECRFNDNGTPWHGAANGQVIWDLNGMWNGIPDLLSVFLRNFKGTEGYTGKQYSLPWLHSFLASKGKEYASVDDMRHALEIENVPFWFDRNAWVEILKRAGIQ